MFRNKLDNGLIDWYLIDNGSTDISHRVFQQVIKKHNDFVYKTYHVRENFGYGYGLKKFIIDNLDKYEVIIWTHADGQTPLNDVIRAFNFLQNTIILN